MSARDPDRLARTKDHLGTRVPRDIVSVEPALGPQEWDRLRREGSEDLLRECLNRPAALIAIANHMLPASDERKLTRESVHMLRSLTAKGLHFPKYEAERIIENQLRGAADAIESYLPPEK